MFAFFVDFVYEKLPSFCSSCKVIGHSLANGKFSVKEDVGNKEAAKKKVVQEFVANWRN